MYYSIRKQLSEASKVPSENASVSLRKCSILSSGYCITPVHRSGTLNNGDDFSQVWRVKSSISGCQHHQVLVRAHFLVYRRLSSCCVLTRQRTNNSPSPFLVLQGHQFHHRCSSFQTSSKPNYPSKPHFLIPSCCGLEFQHNNFEGTQAYSQCWGWHSKNTDLSPGGKQCFQGCPLWQTEKWPWKMSCFLSLEPIIMLLT